MSLLLSYQLACLCVLSRIDFASFYDFSIEFRNCSDNVVFVVFHVIRAETTLTIKRVLIHLECPAVTCCLRTDSGVPNQITIKNKALGPKRWFPFSHSLYVEIFQQHRFLVVNLKSSLQKLYGIATEYLCHMDMFLS